MNLDFSRLDLSAYDGVLGVLLLVVIVWAGLKLAARFMMALVVIVLIGVGFFGLHLDDLSNAAGDAARAAEGAIDIN
jgi:hypothetical protein